MPDNNYDLQIFICAGREDAHRATLGLSTALAALAAGQRVLLFFTMRGAQWTSPQLLQHDDVPGFPPVADLIEMLLGMDAEMEGCTSCVDNHLLTALDETGHRTMREGFRHGGLASASLRMHTTPTTVF